MLKSHFGPFWSWTSCLWPLTGPFFTWDSKAHGPVHHLWTVVQRVSVSLRQLPDFTSVRTTWSLSSGMAALWRAWILSSYRSTWRNLKKPDASREKLHSYVQGGSKLLFQRNGFSRFLRSNPHAVSPAPVLLSSSKQGLFLQSCVISSLLRQPSPEHRWNSSVEKSAEKVVLFSSPKVWFWRIAMISPLSLALLLFLFVSSSSLGIFRVWKRREMKQTEHPFDSGRWLSGLIASVGIIVREMHT